MPVLFARHAALTLGLFGGLAGGYFATAQLPAMRAGEPVFTSKRRDGLVDIVEKVKSAVVNIHSERTVAPTIDDPFRTGVNPLQAQRVNGMGTGIVLDPRGYIITNYHVVDDIQSLKCRLVDGQQASAKIVALDKKADLALIKIDVPNPLPIVPLGTASDLLDAEQVIAIGNAYGYEHTVSIGNIAYKSRDVSLNKEISYHGLIQTTAPINPGNSGGPLFNKKGELVGINVAIRAGAQNIAFAIAVDNMIDRAADMLSVKKRNGVRHGLILKDHAERPGEEAAVKRTVIVEGVETGSPASALGIRAGDVITKVGDVDTFTTIDVERGFLDRSGSPVAVQLKRGGEMMKLGLDLQALDKNSTNPDVVLRRLGVKLVPVTKDVVTRVDAQLRGGLAISDVQTGSAAAKAGLVRGDVVIGFHQWEAVSLENVLFVLNHKDLPTFNPLKTFFIRDGKVRETMLAPAE